MTQERHEEIEVKLVNAGLLLSSILSVADHFIASFVLVSLIHAEDNNGNLPEELLFLGISAKELREWGKEFYRLQRGARDGEKNKKGDDVGVGASDMSLGWSLNRWLRS